MRIEIPLQTYILQINFTQTPCLQRTCATPFRETPCARCYFFPYTIYLQYLSHDPVNSVSPFLGLLAQEKPRNFLHIFPTMVISS